MTLTSAVFVCKCQGGPDCPEDLFGDKPEPGTGYSACGQIDKSAALYQFTAPKATIDAMAADTTRWCKPDDAKAKALLEKDPTCKAVTDRQDWKAAAKAEQNTLAALGVTAAEYARVSVKAESTERER